MEYARAKYAKLGVDVDKALQALNGIQLSLPCWQGDDVKGFEHAGSAASSGGIAAIGGHPGAARTPAELRADVSQALKLIPGKHRLNLHAIYGEFGGKEVDRDQIATEHFQGWIAWAKESGVALDFNPTLFGHPRAASNLTLSSKDAATRDFWIEHVKRSRTIAQDIAHALGTPVVNNIWIPDGFKDTPVDRAGHRVILRDSLDKIFAQGGIDKKLVVDAVEGKLFGLGLEACTVGTHDFYLGYAVSRGVALCMDMGHFHPTESVGDKISAVLPFCERVLLHVSRPVRWDSDHVSVIDDALTCLADEVVRSGALDRIYLALDFFDASINRVGAWVVGARAVQKALLAALLQPRDKLRELEEAGKNFERLALLEECKAMPLGAVWDHFCETHGVPAGADWIPVLSKYEQDVLLARK